MGRWMGRWMDPLTSFGRLLGPFLPSFPSSISQSHTVMCSPFSDSHSTKLALWVPFPSNGHLPKPCTVSGAVWNLLTSPERSAAQRQLLRGHSEQDSPMGEANEWRGDYICIEAVSERNPGSTGPLRRGPQPTPRQEFPLDPKLGSTIEPHPK